MKFFEWASFLLASVVSGGDVPTLFNSSEILSAPKIVVEKRINLSSEKKSSKPLEPGVTLHIPEGSSLVVEEKVEIRVGDRFAAVIVDPVSGEIFSQSEWVEVKK